MKRLTQLSALACVSILFLTGCSDNDRQPQITSLAEPTGSLLIQTVTTGTAFDDNGYTASLDCGCHQHMETNDAHTMSGVAVGRHMVVLMDVANGCSVDGPNPRFVNVIEGGTAETTFTVRCGG